jgi:Protein required for attachment to host cells
MKNTLVVVTDLACLKAYRLENNHPNKSLRLELVEEFNNAEAHGKLGDKVSDLSGRFPRRTGAQHTTGAMSDGERHNIELESRKRLVRQLAQRLNRLLGSKEVERCLLAASREINHQLLEELEPLARAKIEKNIPVDLTKLDRAEILGHF